MRIARLAVRGRTVLGIATDGDYAIVDPDVAGMAAALAPGARSVLEQAISAGARVPAAQAQLLVPFDAGTRLFCIGTNYRSHAGETPAQPAVFIRTPESIVAATSAGTRASTTAACAIARRPVSVRVVRRPCG